MQRVYALPIKEKALHSLDVLISFQSIVRLYLAGVACCLQLNLYSSSSASKLCFSLRQAFGKKSLALTIVREHILNGSSTVKLNQQGILGIMRNYVDKGEKICTQMLEIYK